MYVFKYFVKILIEYNIITIYVPFVALLKEYNLKII